MDKRELSSKINKRLKKEKLSSSIHQTRRIVDIVFDETGNQLSLGKYLSISNFGSFNSNLENRFINGEKIKRYVLKFKASRRLKDLLNEEIK